MICLRVMSDENTRLAELREKLKKKVGKRLAEARGKEISQQGIADELKRYGIERTQGSISQIEKGVRLPSLEMFYVMVRHLGGSADYVLGLTDDPQSPADIEEDRLGMAISRLPRDKREQVIGFAEYLASQEEAKSVEVSDGFKRWVAITEVLVRHRGKEGEVSVIDLLSSDYPDLAAALGVPPKKKSAKDG